MGLSASVFAPTSRARVSASRGLTSVSKKMWVTLRRRAVRTMAARSAGLGSASGAMPMTGTWVSR